MTSHTDACQLAERAAHLMRLGLAVDMARNKGIVEVLISDLDATAHVLAHGDLAHAVDKGGDVIDGPVALTDEPSGDAMRWRATSEPTECEMPGCTREPMPDGYYCHDCDRR